MASAAARRLMNDLKGLQADLNGVTASPRQNNIMVWDAVIFGPEDTIWEGAVLKLEMIFTDSYPSKPPDVRFTTTVFHPNVYADGRICIDILGPKWTSIYNVSSILTSLQSLLTDPNPDSPANREAAELFRSERETYEKRVRACVEKSWDDCGDIDE